MKMMVKIWNSIIRGFVVVYDIVALPFLSVAVMIDESRRQNLDGSWDDYWDRYNRRLRRRERRRYIRKADKQLRRLVKKLIVGYDSERWSMQDVTKILKSLAEQGKIDERQVAEIERIVHG